MTSSPFKPHPPFLLSPPSSSSSSFPKKQQLPRPPTEDLAGFTWHMIASSSSMWQDRKHSLTISYSTSATDSNTSEFNDLTTWYGGNSDKESSTQGISSPVATDSGYVYNWRGTGWLRLITTSWEIVGLGVLSPLFHADANGTDEREKVGIVNENGVVVLVTFVKKTLFSPQAVSIFIGEARLSDAQEENVIKDVMEALRSLGVGSLSAEIEKLKAIPRK